MTKYIIKKTMFYNGINKGDTYITENFSCSKITDLMKKYAFKDYQNAFNFLLEKKHFDYMATIKLDNNYKFNYEIIKIEE